jgi:hypothetical protein
MAKRRSRFSALIGPPSYFLSAKLAANPDSSFPSCPSSSTDGIGIRSDGWPVSGLFSTLPG